MSVVVLKSSEVISTASGIFEGYDKAGPFIVVRDFDLEASVEQTKAAIKEPWEISELMHEIPRMLVARGLTSAM